MRLLAVMCLLVLLAPVASATLDIKVTARSAPVPFATPVAVTATLTVECKDILARPSPDGLTVALLSTALDKLENVTVEGPDSYTFPTSGCAEPTSTASATLAYKLHGTRYTPGLVAQAFLLNASLAPNQVGDLVDPVSPVSTRFNATPTAVVEVRFEAPNQLPAGVAEQHAAVKALSLSNVPVTFTVQAAGAPSLSDGKSVTIPRGTLTLAQDHGLIPRARDAAQPGTTLLNLSYAPPPSGSGEDRFELTIRPAVPLAPATSWFSAPWTVTLKFAYDHGGAGKSGSATIGVRGSESQHPAQTTVTHSSPDVAPLAVCLLALLAASRRR